jgi:hypothetical protein
VPCLCSNEGAYGPCHTVRATLPRCTVQNLLQQSEQDNAHDAAAKTVATAPDGASDGAARSKLGQHDVQRTLQMLCRTGARHRGAVPGASATRIRPGTCPRPIHCAMPHGPLCPGFGLVPAASQAWSQRIQTHSIVETPTSCAKGPCHATSAGAVTSRPFRPPRSLSGRGGLSGPSGVSCRPWPAGRPRRRPAEEVAGPEMEKLIRCGRKRALGSN